MNEKDIKLKDVAWIVIGAPWYIGGMGCFLVFAKQCVDLLRRGDWVPFSGLDLLRLGFDSAWLHTPTDWVGIYKTLNWIHGGLLAAIIGGTLSLALVLLIAPLFEKRE